MSFSDFFDSSTERGAVGGVIVGGARRLTAPPRPAEEGGAPPVAEGGAAAPWAGGGGDTTAFEPVARMETAAAAVVEGGAWPGGCSCKGGAGATAGLAVAESSDLAPPPMLLAAGIGMVGRGATVGAVGETPAEVFSCLSFFSFLSDFSFFLSALSFLSFFSFLSDLSFFSFLSDFSFFSRFSFFSVRCRFSERLTSLSVSEKKASRSSELRLPPRFPIFLLLVVLVFSSLCFVFELSFLTSRFFCVFVIFYLAGVGWMMCRSYNSINQKESWYRDTQRKKKIKKIEIDG